MFVAGACYARHALKERRAKASAAGTAEEMVICYAP